MYELFFHNSTDEWRHPERIALALLLRVSGINNKLSFNKAQSHDKCFQRELNSAFHFVLQYEKRLKNVNRVYSKSYKSQLATSGFLKAENLVLCVQDKGMFFLLQFFFCFTYSEYYC